MTSRLFPETPLIERLGNGSRQISGDGPSTVISAKQYGNVTSNAKLNQAASAWERIDTAQAAVMIEVGPNNRITFFYAAAGANPISWTEIGQLNSAGGFLQKGGEALRTLRGQISSAGAVLLGSGFTCSRVAAGNFSISFNTAFSATPVIAPGIFLNGGPVGNIVVSGANAAGATILTYDTAWAASDRPFNFIAVGPA